MRERGTTADSAAQELLAVLEGLSLPAELDGREGVRMGSGGTRVAVVELPAPTAAQIREMLQDASADIGVVVSDRLGRRQRDLLAEARWGWLDRRGHLRILAGETVIDRDVDSLTGPDTRPLDPLGRISGLTVALWLLENPGVEASIRAIAKSTDLSVGSVARSVSDLEDLGLVQAGRRPAVPDLFWEVAAKWRLRWFALDERPDPDLDGHVARLVSLGLDDLIGPGWASVGAEAAQAYGVRVVSQGERTRLLVPGQRALTWALRTWGAAEHPAHGGVEIAVPPSHLPTVRRVDSRMTSGTEGWPLARPLYVALTLAARSHPRDPQLLDAWEPDPAFGQPRVW